MLRRLVLASPRLATVPVHEHVTRTFEARRVRREARDLTSSPISSAVVLLGLESACLGNSST